MNIWTYLDNYLLFDTVLGRPHTSDFNRCDNRGSDCRSRREATH